MRKKRSKEIRNRADSLAIQFVKDRIITEEEWSKHSELALINALPRTTYYRKGFTVHLGVGCRRWIEKQVKKNEYITYQEMLKIGNLV